MTNAAIPVYYINLARRIDRKNEIIKEIAKISPLISEVNRIDGIETPENGAIGCAASHCIAIQQYMVRSESPWAIILEDDFSFNYPAKELFIALENLKKLLMNADVALLSLNLRYGLPTEIPGIIRVYSALTTSGYMLTRSYAHTLLRCFQESHENLRYRLSHLPKDTANALSAIDISWQRLQISGKFLAYNPALGKQRPSVSDISNQFADYKV